MQIKTRKKGKDQRINSIYLRGNMKLTSWNVNGIRACVKKKFDLDIPQSMLESDHCPLMVEF